MRTVEVQLNNTWNGKLAMEPVKVEIEKGLYLQLSYETNDNTWNLSCFDYRAKYLNLYDIKGDCKRLSTINKATKNSSINWDVEFVLVK